MFQDPEYLSNSELRALIRQMAHAIEALQRADVDRAGPLQIRWVNGAPLYSIALPGLTVKLDNSSVTVPDVSTIQLDTASMTLSQVSAGIALVGALASGSSRWTINTPPAFTTDQDPFSPTADVVQRISSTVPVKIITMTPGSPGDIHVLVNIGTQPIFLPGNDSGTDGTFLVDGNNDFDSGSKHGYALGPYETALCYLDPFSGPQHTAKVWQVVNLNPWSSPPPSNFTAVNGVLNNWALQSGTVQGLENIGGNLVLTGMAGGYHGRRIIVIQEGSGADGYWISFNDGRSLAANQIWGTIDHFPFQDLGAIGTGAMVPPELGQVFIQSEASAGSGGAAVSFLYNEFLPGWILESANSWYFCVAGRAGSQNNAYLTKQLSFNPANFGLSVISGELVVGPPNVADRSEVIGSRGGNAALHSLLSALVSLGLITDSTTP